MSTAAQAVVPSVTGTNRRPALIAEAGKRASLPLPRILTVNIRNANTRRETGDRRRGTKAK